MIRRTLLSLTALTTVLAAQNQPLRGKVEDVQNTQNQFFLGCTNIPLVSTAVNLNNWIGADALMQVTNVGTATSPTLRVDAIQTTPQTLEMGNLRFNQARNWTVFAPANSFAVVAIDFTANTGFTPLGSLGTYLLGSNSIVLRSGFAGANNEFLFQFTMPNAPNLTGVPMSSQALIVEPSLAAYLSNPDCKDIGN